ncbi:hypothetical protein NHQ30_002741 [Ciborinia camelliae]|nr:hypothetical protein NHQ30_002741 [Ciborinia camelliae]
MLMIRAQKFHLALTRLQMALRRLQQLTLALQTQAQRIHRPQGIRMHEAIHGYSLLEDLFARFKRVVPAPQLRETFRRVGECPDGMRMQGPEGDDHGMVGLGVQGERFVRERRVPERRPVAAREGVLRPDDVVVCGWEERFESAEGAEMQGFGFAVFLEVPTDAPEFVDRDYYVEVVVGEETGGVG